MNLTAIQPKKTRRYWVLWILGSISGLVAILALTAIVVLGYCYLTYTSRSGKPVTSAGVTIEDQSAYGEKVNTFFNGLGSNERLAPLRLGPKDLNAFVVSTTPFRSNVCLSIISNVIAAEFSLPMGAEGLPGPSGRFLNGKANLTLGMGANGRLALAYRKIEMNGRELPRWVLPVIASIDRRLFLNFRITNIKSIDIRDNELIFTPVNAIK